MQRHPPIKSYLHVGWECWRGRSSHCLHILFLLVLDKAVNGEWLIDVLQSCSTMLDNVGSRHSVAAAADESHRCLGHTAGAEGRAADKEEKEGSQKQPQEVTVR